MKIESVDLPVELQTQTDLDYGLQDIKMSRLGKIVLLAGPNGAGKSRLLQLIGQIAEGWRQDFEGLHVHQTEIRRSKSACEDRLKSLAVGNESDRSRFETLIREYESNLATTATKIRCFDAIRTRNNASFKAVSYRVRQTTLTSVETLAPNRAREKQAALAELGAEAASEAASAYAKQVLLQGWNASHQDTLSTSETAAFIEARDTLVSLLSELLGEACKAKLEPEGYVSLFGQKDYETLLSDGQKVLFQLACALHAQGAKLDEAIIFLDEPENHLHPLATIEIVDRLSRFNISGQIWIATHSVPLVAHLVDADPSCLWYAEAGSFVHAGRKPEKVLDGLIGGARNIHALQNFAALPARFAINRFLAECLLPPAVIGSDVNDPQTDAITRYVRELRTRQNDPRAIRVLDFGAGKGRLLASMAANLSDSSQLKDEINYVAYDSDGVHSATCVAEIEAVYGTEEGSKRYFNNLELLKSSFDEQSFHVVVLCNVLHEVPPAKWFEFFGSNGYFSKFLRADGGLLIVEDYNIPIGELAHSDGFLLLDQGELKKLFAWKEQDSTDGLFHRQCASESRYKDRLAMHWIGQPMISRASNSTRAEAIRTLKERARSKIIALRENAATSFADGHEHALSAMLYANASIWLEANDS